MLLAAHMVAHASVRILAEATELRRVVAWWRRFREHEVSWQRAAGRQQFLTSGPSRLRRAHAVLNTSNVEPHTCCSLNCEPISSAMLNLAELPAILWCTPVADACLFRMQLGCRVFMDGVSDETSDVRCHSVLIALPSTGERVDGVHPAGNRGTWHEVD